MRTASERFKVQLAVFASFAQHRLRCRLKNSADDVRGVLTMQAHPEVATLLTSSERLTDVCRLVERSLGEVQHL